MWGIYLEEGFKMLNMNRIKYFTPIALCSSGQKRAFLQVVLKWCTFSFINQTKIYGCSFWIYFIPLLWMNNTHEKSWKNARLVFRRYDYRRGGQKHVNICVCPSQLPLFVLGSCRPNSDWWNFVVQNFWNNFREPVTLRLN